jgi:hypothetical protein
MHAPSEPLDRNGEVMVRTGGLGGRTTAPGQVLRPPVNRAW